MSNLPKPDLLTLTFIPISILLAGSIIISSQPRKRWIAWLLYASALTIFTINEWAIRRYYPEYNIRFDLIILIPLALIAMSRLAFSLVDESSSPAGRLLSPAGKLARRSLSLSLINVPFWMLPVLSILGVISGHRALSLGVKGADRAKALIGLLVGYGQIIAAAALWLSMFE